MFNLTLSETCVEVDCLLQVVAMKLECHPSSFTADPEGSQLASSINQHLPAEVRFVCFSVHTGAVLMRHVQLCFYNQQCNLPSGSCSCTHSQSCSNAPICLNDHNMNCHVVMVPYPCSHPCYTVTAYMFGDFQ